LNQNKIITKKISIKKEKFLWGEESRWTNNRLYIAKNIFLKRRTILTKKFHKNTIKTFFIISGRMDLFVEKGNSSHTIKLLPDDAYEIYPETIYSISAVTDVKYIEVSNHISGDTYSYKKRKND
jgi:mannose-6-phosphate isomerase-like protein (cupin superfamily)